MSCSPTAGWQHPDAGHRPARSPNKIPGALLWVKRPAACTSGTCNEMGQPLASVLLKQGHTASRCTVEVLPALLTHAANRCSCKGRWIRLLVVIKSQGACTRAMPTGGAHTAASLLAPGHNTDPSQRGALPASHSLGAHRKAVQSKQSCMPATLPRMCSTVLHNPSRSKVIESCNPQRSGAAATSTPAHAQRHRA